MIQPNDDSEWMAEGLCRQIGSNLWFPDSNIPAENKKQATKAKRMCRRCPVTETCLRWALERDEQWGVWGAKNLGAMRPHQRRKLRSELGIKLIVDRNAYWEHGTEAGYKRHLRAGQIPCAACTDGSRIASRERERRRREDAS